MLGATVTIHHLNHFNFTISLWAQDFRSLGGFLGHCALWPATTQTHPFFPPHPPPALSPHPTAYPPIFQFFTSFRPFQLFSPFLCHFAYLRGHFFTLEPLTYPFYTLWSFHFYIPHKYRFLRGEEPLLHTFTHFYPIPTAI